MAKKTVKVNVKAPKDTRSSGAKRPVKINLSFKGGSGTQAKGKK